MSASKGDWMNVTIDSLVEGASRARGTVVVIDVYRAFTTAAVAFDRGAKKLILVSDADDAIGLRENGTAELCIGESDGIKRNGFDYGNSPFELSDADLAGKSIVQCTSAGTLGIGLLDVNEVDDIFLGSFVVAGATVDVLRDSNPQSIHIVSMGASGCVRTDEDEQCALYLRNLLAGRAPDKAAVRSLVISGAESEKFDDPTKPHFHKNDQNIALDFDRYGFAMRVMRENNLMVAYKQDVG
jgi:2-phosphosulfolactate phosphatase